MPYGKQSGVRCVQLDEENRCKIFESPDRPAVCAGLKPSEEMCGDSQAQAIRWLLKLEKDTSSEPNGQKPR